MSQAAYDAVKMMTQRKVLYWQTAVIAAVMGAKKTSDLIPMCHPLLLTSIKTDIEDMPELPGFKLFVTAKLMGKPVLRWKPLSGVGIGLLTIYDMLKSHRQKYGDK